MRILVYCLCAIFCIIGSVSAQTAPAAAPAAPAPPELGWKHSLVTAVTINQVAFTDWAQGGTNSLSWGATADGKSVDEMESVRWSNAYRFAFGQARIGTQGTRKTDDRIELEAVLTYKAGWLVEPYFGASLKSQFAPGYTYDAANVKTQVSKFFDPAYLVQSAGAAYQPAPEVKTRLGVGLREIVTSQFTMYADDPATTKIEKTSVKGGLESVTNVDLKIDDNVLFSTQLELFDAFQKLDQVIVRSTSSVTAKAGKFVTVILSLQLINERQVTPRTQVQQTLGIGASFTLF